MRRSHVLGGVVVVVGLAFGFMGGEYSTFDWLELRNRVADSEADLERLRAEIDSIAVLADSLETDSAAIERLVRENMGMIRDGEIQFRFEEVIDSTGS